MIKEKIIYFGTSEIAVPCLQKLIDKHFNIVCVVSQPDKPQGRKQILVPSPVKKAAIAKNIKVIQPKKVSVDDIKEFDAELGILFSYGQIIKPEVLEYFKYGILNLHPSLLPKYRGPSPIQSAIINGDKQTGTSIIKLVDKLDAGPILAQQTIDIEPEDDAQTLSDKLAVLSAELLINSMTSYISDQNALKPQNEANASYSSMISKEDALVNLGDDPEHIIRKLKAYTPWPGIYFKYKEKRYKIKKAHIDNNELIIDIIQPEGKKEMLWYEFKQGNKELASCFFSSIKT